MAKLKFVVESVHELAVAAHFEGVRDGGTAEHDNESDEVKISVEYS